MEKTQEQVKQLEQRATARRAEINQARDAYVLALAKHQVTEELDEQARQTVLNREVFKVAEENADLTDGKTDRITRPSQDDLMNESDFKKYIELCHAERLKLGLYAPDANTTSDYETRPALRRAKDDLIKIALAVMPDDIAEALKNMSHNPTIEAQFIEATMRWNI